MELSERDFEAIRAFVYEAAGISLAPVKRSMVANRLSRRVRELALDDDGEVAGMAHGVSKTVAEIAARRRWDEDDARVVLEAARRSGLSLGSFASCTTPTSPHPAEHAVRHAQVAYTPASLPSGRRCKETAETPIHGRPDRIGQLGRAVQYLFTGLGTKQHVFDGHATNLSSTGRP